MILTDRVGIFLFWELYMKKPTLCLIFGGKSREYDISLLSTDCILRHIDREKYDIRLIGITRDGKWYIYNGDEEKIRNGEWEGEREKSPVILDINNGEIIYKAGNTVRLRPNAVLPMIHGDYGEDGRLQSLFDIMRIRCCGIGVEGAALTVNKYITKLIAKEISVPVADFYMINKKSMPHIEKICKMGEELGYPLFVKASSCGSSVGVYRVKSEGELLPRIRDALSFSDTVLLEREIRGTETEIGVIEKNGELHLGKIGQIKYTGDFYDYDAKYKKGDSVCIIPAKISEKSEKILREYAKRLFYAAMCRGFCRMDFFVTDKGEVIFNEINTIPGFTSGSMFPLLMQDKEGDISGVIDSMLMN